MVYITRMKNFAHTLGQLPLANFIFSLFIFGAVIVAGSIPYLASAHDGPHATPRDPKVPLYTIVVLGDSLTEGYGIPKEQAFPALLENKLHDAGATQVKVINAGISGSTTASAVQRLTWILKTKPSLVIVALGANDGLRGIPVKTMKENLSAALQKIKEAKAEAILAGMKVPPNYGKAYADGFEKTFTDLSKQHQVKLIPFLLDGTAGNKDLTQPDGLHPNEKGQVIIANTVYNHLGDLREKLIKANPPAYKLKTPDERRPK